MEFQAFNLGFIHDVAGGNYRLAHPIIDCPTKTIA
jgi:hypothetical protein